MEDAGGGQLIVSFGPARRLPHAMNPMRCGHVQPSSCASPAMSPGSSGGRTAS